MLGSRAVVAKLWPQLRTRKRGIARHSGPQAQNHRAEVVSVCQSTQILNTLRCCVFRLHFQGPHLPTIDHSQALIVAMRL